jgi:hypothetical protein
VAVRDVIFVSCSAPLIAACVVRPDRPRLGALGLAADVGLVAVLALFIYVYFPVAHLALGVTNPYQHLAPVLYNPQRVMLLVLLLWLLRTSEGTWRRLYEELALAIAIFHAGSVVSNLALVGGSYRPGLYDLPWAVPLLWVALAARDWQPEPRILEADAEDLEAAAWQARDWQEARRGNVVALAAVCWFRLHLLATLVGSPGAFGRASAATSRCRNSAGGRLHRPPAAHAAPGGSHQTGRELRLPHAGREQHRRHLT